MQLIEKQQDVSKVIQQIAKGSHPNKLLALHKHKFNRLSKLWQKASHQPFIYSLLTIFVQKRESLTKEGAI